MRKGHILKEKILKNLKQMIEENSFIILTDPTGLTVSEITKLRRELFKAQAIYYIAKNRLFVKGASNLGFSVPPLTGPTGFIFAQNPPFASKTLLNFIKKEKRPSIKFAFLDKKILKKEDVEHIALLPGRPVLISQVISSLQAPIFGLVQVLSSIIRNLLYTLEAIVHKKNV